MTAPALAPRPAVRRQAPARFPPRTALQAELREAVDTYFARNGRVRHGGARLAFKSAIIFGWAVASYLTLVFHPINVWHALLAAGSLGLAIAAIGFNVQHDAGHGSYTGSPRFNRLIAWSLDLVGGSSYIWNYKHNLVHHHYTNVEGIDEDIEAGPLLRLAPGQPLRWYHRYQHVYVWLLYMFLPPKWEWYDDFRDVIRGRVGSQPMPRPRGMELVGLLAGKLIFLGWSLALPLMLHSPLHVLLMYAFVSLVTGVTLATVFQLAHCVDEASFHTPPSGGGRMPTPWVEHQLSTTVDFCPDSPVLTWFLGGLNFQVEHHLFPRVSHVHYPALARIVRGTCKAQGVRHVTHHSLREALGSHVRYLKRMGAPAGTSS